MHRQQAVMLKVSDGFPIIHSNQLLRGLNGICRRGIITVQMLKDVAREPKNCSNSRAFENLRRTAQYSLTSITSDLESRLEAG